MLFTLDRLVELRFNPCRFVLPITLGPGLKSSHYF